MSEKRKRYKGLIVDDAMMNREMLKEILKDDILFIEATTGEDAKEILMEHFQELDIVLLDLVMPGMSGFDVLEFMRSKHMTDYLPVMIISVDDMENNIERAFDLGAIDFITRPFSERTVKRRVLTTVSLFAKQKQVVTEIDQDYLVGDKRADRLTGVDLKKTFYSNVHSRLKQMGEVGAIMVAADIANFKLYNNFYGWEKGDIYLQELAKKLKELVQRHGGYVGYMGGDDFAMFAPNAPALMLQLHTMAEEEGYFENFQPGFHPKFGIYVLGAEEDSAHALYDRAKMALASIKGDYTLNLKMYEAEMSQRVEDDFQLLVDIRRGENNQEFEFFLQPKYEVATGRVVASEALVRWIHKDKGLVVPGAFVPALERTGFISNVDVIVWEEVCRWQRQCMDAGRSVLPISVNVSKADIFMLDVTATLDEMIDRYQLTRDLIQIEVSETAYTEDPERVGREIQRLHNGGYTVLLDDFGKGSFNLVSLKYLPINELKLDMRFLSVEFEEIEQDLSILEFVINMAKKLNIKTVAEGVETKEQVEVLKKLGCDMAQGYIYQRPMPAKVYAALIASKTK